MIKFHKTIYSIKIGKEWVTCIQGNLLSIFLLKIKCYRDNYQNHAFRRL